MTENEPIEPAEPSRRRREESIEEVGFTSLTWVQSLYKRFIDGISGKGGVEGFSQFLNQIDFIPELSPLRPEMAYNSLLFEAALAKCTKEMLKRPLNIRENGDNEAVDLMGATCKNGACGYETSLINMMRQSRKCPRCGGELTSTYAKVLRELVALRLTPTPEAVLMFRAYNKITVAYVDSYKAQRLVLEKTAALLGWEQYHLDNEKLKNYLDQYFLGRLAGETKIPREEKEVLQYIIRAGLAGIGVEEAEAVIHAAMTVVKYGYLFEVLGCVGAQEYYAEANLLKAGLYDKSNAKIRVALAIAKATTKGPTISLSGVIPGQYAPCLLMPRYLWDSGEIAKNLLLKPLYKLPIFPKTEQGSLQFVVSCLGGGKTTMLGAFNTVAVEQKGEVVFNVLGDEDNSFCLAGLPQLEYSERTNNLAGTLRNDFGVEPHGLPTLNLAVLPKGDAEYGVVQDTTANPPTIFDRVLYVENPHGFEVNFDAVWAELKKIAAEYGYAKTAGIINIRNLKRLDSAANTNIDVQISTSMLMQFGKWRKSHKTPCRAQFDEISYFAPTKLDLYGADASKSGATLSDYIKESRRNGTSIDAATQSPKEVVPEVRVAAINTFFRDLAVDDRDKSSSQIDRILGTLQLSDPSIKPVIREINNRGLLPKHFWFWHNRPERKIEVIKPCPPPFILQDPDKTALQLFKMYENKTGRTILLENWKEVPVIGTHLKETKKKLTL